jgi:hypothetical protein
MSNALLIDLFAEDRGHEELLRPLLRRLARDQEKAAQVRVRSARGGHGRALAELDLYQKSVLRIGRGEALPDLLVVAIDGNCDSFAAARGKVRAALRDEFQDRTVHACPDPHVERWYLADLEAFHEVVGITPRVGKQKCEKNVYKALLAKAVADAGHPPILGGIEFARELAEAMDPYRAGKADNSLKHFLEEATACLKSL